MERKRRECQEMGGGGEREMRGKGKRRQRGEERGMEEEEDAEEVTVGRGEEGRREEKTG